MQTSVGRQQSLATTSHQALGLCLAHQVRGNSSVRINQTGFGGLELRFKYVYVFEDVSWDIEIELVIYLDIGVVCCRCGGRRGGGFLPARGAAVSIVTTEG